MTSSSRAAAPAFPWGGLLALAVASFFSISGEMLPTGLLPEIGSDLHVRESAVGLLVTVFAFTVVATSTLLTQLTKRIPRHRLLLALIVVIAVGALGTGLAPTYGWIVVARIVGGMAHGVFWAITGAYAAHLVPREQVGRALAVSSSGGTLAFVLGVPLGTALGQGVGWRLAFVILAALMLASLVLVWRLLPDVGSAASPSESSESRQDARAAAEGSTPVGPGALATGSILIVAPGTKRPRERPAPSMLAVALTCIVTGLFMVGHYSFYTYIAPFLTSASGLPGGQLGLALFAYGVAGAGSLALVGWMLGKHTGWSIPVAMATVVAAVIALVVFEGHVMPSFVVFMVLGLAFGTLPPLLQTRLLQVAPASRRDLASAFFTSSFNAGIGLGALLGGLLLTGVGVDRLPVFYIVVAIVMFVVTVVSDALLRRRGTAAFGAYR